MGKFSDDTAVDEAVVSLEQEHLDALQAFRENRDDPDAKAAHDEAKAAFANARQATREGRVGHGVTTTSDDDNNE